MKRRLGCALLLIASLALVACGTNDDATDTPSDLVVVATTTQIGDMAKQVVGDRGTVRVLLTPNADAHDYEPTPGDATAVADSDVVLVNGADLDGWVDGVVTSSGTTATPTVLSGSVQLRTEDGGDDPHIWFDPRNAEKMVNAIADATSAAAPSDAPTFRANADRYIDEIRTLDVELAARVAAVPKERRVIVTDHDAFGYLTDHYDIRVVGAVIPSLATTAEPNAKELQDLIGLIRTENVRVVFPEASIDPRLAKRIADESGARLGGELYSDSLGEAGSGADTYLGMMRVNVATLVDGMTSA